MQKLFHGVIAVSIVAFASVASAEISWVGGTSDDVFDESNWDLSSSSVTVIDPNVSIADNVLIGVGPFTNNAVIPDLGGQVRLQLDDGFTLRVEGQIDYAGNDGVGGAPGSTNGPTVEVVNGGAFNPFFVVNDVKVNIDSLSTATFGGGGNPINVSTLHLDPGATVTFLAETPDQYRAEHLSKTFVLGTAGVEGVNLTIEAFGNAGSLVTAVPEPATVGLAGLAGMLLLMSRRRRA